MQQLVSFFDVKFRGQLVPYHQLKNILKIKDATVWMVNVDHLSGESLGAAFQKLLDLGAMNVQIVPSVTKKNRPGYILFLDVPNTAANKKLEEFLIKELGITGYHRLITEHHYEPTRIIQRRLCVWNGDKKIKLNIDLKCIDNDLDRSFPRIEHDSLVAIQRKIELEFNKLLSLREITTFIESADYNNDEEIYLEVQ